MNTSVFGTTFGLLLCACLPSSAGESELLLVGLTDQTIVARDEAIAPNSPHGRVFSDFQGRLQQAVGSGSPLEIRGLYQTNSVAADSLRMEVTRWKSLLRSATNSPLGLYFKELRTLPPKAREVWTQIASRLTSRDVTHLVQVSVGPGTRTLMLPLILIDDRLWVVPSDKIDPELGIEQ